MNAGFKFLCEFKQCKKKEANLLIGADVGSGNLGFPQLEILPHFLSYFIAIWRMNSFALRAVVAIVVEPFFVPFEIFAVSVRFAAHTRVFAGGFV